ncbi:MAG TPA: hypothetical protein VJT71_19985 [Pyrinomonadaceae bacterium]|nr:hypothetical protein [Pyrinomonadaceae bacterium]
MRKYQRTAWVTLGSALFALAPKCPVCFLAYFGIFGVATASTSVYRVWLPPLTALWLALTIGMLAFGRDTGRKAGPVLLGIFAAIAIFAGRFSINDQRLVFAGLAGLVTATIWRSWLRKRNIDCGQCEERSEASRTPLNAEIKP